MLSPVFRGSLRHVTWEQRHNDQRVRAVQDRRRAFVLAYGGPDAGGRGLRCGPAHRARGSVKATLLGSLAFTGKGHATDRAVILGLAGLKPDTLDLAEAEAVLRGAHEQPCLPLAGRRKIAFDPAADIIFDYVTPPTNHPNTLKLAAFDAGGAVVAEETWLSVGGGFIVRDGEALADGPARRPIRCRSATPLNCWQVAATKGLSIAELVRCNEEALASARGCRGASSTPFSRRCFPASSVGSRTDGQLPGGLKVQRRAKAIFDRLNVECKPQRARGARDHGLSSRSTRWRSTRRTRRAAASSRRRPTAPPASFPRCCATIATIAQGASREGLRCFLLTAGAVGALFKLNASISGAEVGCQGEVGVASSMAAAGLCAALGGTNGQVENAAEIAMEHHLGMTCDPIGGLVQIPCIERNAFGAIKAIAAASLALHGDGSHKVSLDQVIATMRQTGADMQTKYKETSLGGFAVNFVEC